jgi:Lysyl oxidase
MAPLRRTMYKALSAAVAAALGVAVLQPASAGTPVPSLRLFAATERVVAVKSGPRVWVDPGMWVASTGGAFELHVSRPDYDSPVDLRQVDAGTGTLLVDLPDDLLLGLHGLEDFFGITIRNQDGDVVRSVGRHFCPNDGERQRLNDQGPLRPLYPWSCGGSHPLTLGGVWGVEDGWSSSALGYRGAIRVTVPVGLYTLEMRIKNPYRALLGISPEDSRATVELRVKRGGSDGGHEAREARHDVGTGAFVAGVPDDPDPDPATLPDLVAMPAWQFETFSRNGRDLLAFGATEWNGGPQPLVVEGFRRPGTNRMDAYQYFYEGGVPVGRAKAGSMMYHAAQGHRHWHFTQFTRYSLLDETKTEVVESGKQSWCLAPTDAIDLTVEGANYLPGQVGFAACGGKSSIWVREVLDVGWGDTYVQYVAGQAFNITNVPNGVYFVEVLVNPEGRLHETDTTNNVELRRVRLLGTPGNRRVIVPPWHGIDTEGGFASLVP